MKMGVVKSTLYLFFIMIIDTNFGDYAGLVAFLYKRKINLTNYVFFFLFSNHIDMKKNFLFAALAVLLAGFWFGGASLASDLDCSENAVANSGVVACIGDTWYTKLQNAINAANSGNTIKLLNNINMAANEEISINKELIINWEGHYIEWASSGNTSWHDIEIKWDWNITINNLTLKNFWNEQNLGDWHITPILVVISYKWKLTLNNVNIEWFNRWAITFGGGSFVMNNCIISGDVSREYQWGITSYIGGNGEIHNTTITNIKKHSDVGVYGVLHSGTWTIIIDNTIIDGDWAVAISAISNSVASLLGTGTSNGTIILWDWNQFNWNDSVLTIAKMGNDSAQAEGISISTIKVIGWNYSWDVEKDTDTSVAEASFKIQWWTFSVNPETSGYVDTWYYAKDNGDGTWTVEAQTEISTIEITWVVDPVAWAEPFTWFTVTTWVVLNSTWTGEDDAAFDSFVAGSWYTLTIEISADTWYILSGNYTVTLNWESVTQTANKVSKTYKWKFKVTFDWENEALVESGATVNAPTVSKECNSLDGWYNGEEKVTFPLTVTWNLALTSKWTYACSRSSWWGGGSSRTTTTDTKATTGDNKTVDTAKVEETKADETKANEENKVEEKASMTDAEAVSKFGQEQIDAYKWALENGITTMETVEEARLDQPLTRAELAKMMVVYIAKILEKQPVLTGDVNYQDVKAEELGDLAGYIKLAYQYQIMWINADGTPIDFFNPNGIVSRWEYATVFSRVLFGSLFNKEWEDFYTNHLKALEAAGILSNTEPTIQEMRGWVMLMMYRSSKNADKIAEVISTLWASEQEAADAQSKAEEEKVAEAPEVDATTWDIVEAPEAEATTWDVAEAPEADATTWDLAEVPEAEATTWDVASN